MKAVLVGYGHAARNLHMSAIEESGLRDVVVDVAAVDPVRPDDSSLMVYGSLQDLPAVTASDMFHVTAPPADHLKVVEEIIALGGRRIIVEKPLTTDGRSARQMIDMCAAEGVSLYPVGIWNFSSGMARMRQDLSMGEQVLHYEFEQSKDRVSRTLRNTSHSSAFEVELPHQVLGAIWMFGEIAEVVHAESRPLRSAGLEVAHAGGAYLVVRHRGGLLGTLVGHLDKAQRTRRLRVACAGGDLEIDLPRSKDDSVSRYTDITGRTSDIPDRPLTECLTAAYTADLVAGQARFNVDMHLHCIDVLEEARRKAGVP